MGDRGSKSIIGYIPIQRFQRERGGSLGIVVKEQRVDGSSVFSKSRTVRCTLVAGKAGSLKK